MNETLQQRLARLRRRVRQVLCLYGLSWVVAVVLGAVLLAGLIDWLVHLDDPGVRLIVGIVILAAGGWVAWRYLVEPLRQPLSDLDLALRVERRFPGFNDSLASTVQFLEGKTDARVGSPALQQRVIDRTVRDAQRIELADVIETDSLRRVTIAAMIVCAAAALLIGLNRVEAATALNRLLFPFASHPWPKAHVLRLVTESLQPVAYDPQRPLQVARDETLTLYVENIRGDLPQPVLLHHRLGDREAAVERLRTTTIRDAQGRPHSVAVMSLVVARGPLSFRVTGGDDEQMPWYEVQAVPPPVVDDLQVELTPPLYTGRSVQALPRGVGHLEALVGTEVTIRASASKPLSVAALRVKDRAAQALDIAGDGESFTASFVIDEPGTYSYWFDLKDLQSFENAEPPRYEIRALADAVPDVSIEIPATDLTVTPNAEVPLRVTAKDDLGLVELRLRYRNDQAAEEAGGAFLLRGGDDRPRQTSVEHTWLLAPLGLKPGDRVLFHAEATDECDIGPPHVGRSIFRALTVVTTEEKSVELAARKAELADELEDVLGRQTRAREQVGELGVQLEKTGQLRGEDLDLLKRIELDQRQIGSQLADPVDGVGAKARRLLRELEFNRLEGANIGQRLEQLADEIELLHEANLPVIERELTAARKGAQLLQPGEAARERESGRAAGEEVEASDRSVTEATPAEALSEAGDQQAAVMASLSDLLREMAEWRSRQDLSRDLDELTKGQEELNRESAATGRETLARALADLTPQERADLGRLAERQNRQADRLSRFRDKLSRSAEELAGSDSDAAASLRETADTLNRQATAGRMREASRNLERNNIGQASEDQEQILGELNQLQETLQNRGEAETETLVKQMRQAERELETLRKRQDELTKQSAEALQEADEEERRPELERLRKQQQQLQEQIEDMARRLRRLQARDAAQAARQAASRMEQAGQSLGEDAGDRAAEQQQEALQDLEQAQRELARQRQQAEEQLAEEMLERIADELASMIGRQQTVIDETLRLAAEYQARGTWTRAQSRALLDLADVQRGLKVETDGLAETVNAAEVFALALRGAARQMQRAADLLAERNAGVATLDAERAAHRRIAALVASLENDTEESQPGDTNPPAEPMEPSAGPPTDGIPQLAQLKMMKTLQEELLRRTSELDARRGADGRLTNADEAERNALALEQGELADLARNLVGQFAEPAEVEDSEEAADPSEPDAAESAKPAPPDRLPGQGF